MTKEQYDSCTGFDRPTSGSMTAGEKNVGSFEVRNCLQRSPNWVRHAKFTWSSFCYCCFCYCCFCYCCFCYCCFFFVIVVFVIVVIVIVVVVLLLLWLLLCSKFHSNFYCLRFISSPQEGTYYFVNPVDHYCSSGPQRVKILRYIHPYVVLLYAFSKIFVEAAKDVGEVFCHLRCQ